MPPEKPDEVKETKPKISKPMTGGRIWIIAIVLALALFPTFNFFYNRSVGDPITLGSLFYPSYLENMVGSISSTAGSTYSSITRTITRQTTPERVPTTTTKRGNIVTRNPIWTSLIALVVIFFLYRGFKKRRRERAGEQPGEEPPAETPDSTDTPGTQEPPEEPPTPKSPDKFEPEEYGESIKYLLQKHPAAVLISGRALKTAIDQAYAFQHHEPKPLESIGMLVGFPNPYFKKENIVGLVVPFYVPLPVLVAATDEMTPQGKKTYATYDTDLLSDIENIAKLEFSDKEYPGLDRMYKGLKSLFENYKIKFGPNEVLDRIRGEKLFDPEIRKHFKRMGYIFGEFQDKLGFVGHYHNHPLSEGYDAPALMLLSKEDMDANCEISRQFGGKATSDLLVATQVPNKHTLLKYEGDQGENIGFRFWHSTKCVEESDGKMVGKGGVSDVDFLIFCMDKEIYDWWTTNAPVLDNAGKIINWCEEHQKMIEPKQSPKELPAETEEPIEKILKYLNEVNQRKERVMNYLMELETKKADIVRHLKTLRKEIIESGGYDYFKDNILPLLRDPDKDEFKALSEEKKQLGKLLAAEIDLSKALRALAQLESHLSQNEKKISKYIAELGLSEEEANRLLAEISKKAIEVQLKLKEIFDIAEKEALDTEKLANLLDDKFIEKRVYDRWIREVVKDENLFNALIRQEFERYSSLVISLKRQILLITKLIENLHKKAEISISIESPNSHNPEPAYIGRSIPLQAKITGIESEKSKYGVIWSITSLQIPYRLGEGPRLTSNILPSSLLPPNKDEIEGNVLAVLYKTDNPNFKRYSKVKVIIKRHGPETGKPAAPLPAPSKKSGPIPKTDKFQLKRDYNSNDLFWPNSSSALVGQAHHKGYNLAEQAQYHYDWSVRCIAEIQSHGLTDAVKGIRFDNKKSIPKQNNKMAGRGGKKTGRTHLKENPYATFVKGGCNIIEAQAKVEEFFKDLFQGNLWVKYLETIENTIIQLKNKGITDEIGEWDDDRWLGFNNLTEGEDLLQKLEGISKRDPNFEEYFKTYAKYINTIRDMWVNFELGIWVMNELIGRRINLALRRGKIAETAQPAPPPTPRPTKRTIPKPPTKATPTPQPQPKRMTDSDFDRHFPEGKTTFSQEDLDRFRDHLLWCIEHPRFTNSPKLIGLSASQSFIMVACRIAGYQISIQHNIIYAEKSGTKNLMFDVWRNIIGPMDFRKYMKDYLNYEYPDEEWNKHFGPKKPTPTGPISKRIAIISDIHANMQAFDAVYKDIKSEKINEIYCLGDVVGYGGNPNEVAKKVYSLLDRTKNKKSSLKPIKYIAWGNHDYSVYLRAQPNTYYTDMELTDIGTSEVITSQKKKNYSWYHEPNFEMSFQGSNLFFVHSGPKGLSVADTKDRLLFFTGVLSGARPRENAIECFDIMNKNNYDFCFVGHSHVAGLIYPKPDGSIFGIDPVDKTPLDEEIDLKDHSTAIIDVGSVGQPRDRNSASSYAILTLYQDGEITVRFKRVKYKKGDAKKAIEKMFDDWIDDIKVKNRHYNGIDQAALLKEINIEKRLQSGRLANGT